MPPAGHEGHLWSPVGDLPLRGHRLQHPLQHPRLADRHGHTNGGAVRIPGPRVVRDRVDDGHRVGADHVRFEHAPVEGLCD